MENTFSNHLIYDGPEIKFEYLFAEFSKIKPFVPKLEIRKSYMIKSVLKQTKFPKSKKKRIRKKWSKQSKNFEFVEHWYWDKIGNIIYISEERFNSLGYL